MKKFLMMLTLAGTMTHGCATAEILSGKEVSVTHGSDGKTTFGVRFLGDK
jgi:hypothetical protein